MDISCAPPVAAEFDRALALSHNFWYVRALEQFNQVPKKDSECAMAYWGAAISYNHPFWDPSSQNGEAAGWALVQKGLRNETITRRPARAKRCPQITPTANPRIRSLLRSGRRRLLRLSRVWLR